MWNCVMWMKIFVGTKRVNWIFQKCLFFYFFTTRVKYLTSREGVISINAQLFLFSTVNCGSSIFITHCVSVCAFLLLPSTTSMTFLSGCRQQTVSRGKLVQLFLFGDWWHSKLWLVLNLQYNTLFLQPADTHMQTKKTAHFVKCSENASSSNLLVMWFCGWYINIHLECKRAQSRHLA